MRGYRRLLLGQPPIRFGCVLFFQAEDGIRDLTVTGVQTCALPISNLNLKQLALTLKSVLQRTQNLPLIAYILKFILNIRVTKHIISKKSYFSSLRRYKIGRASCRERV